MTGCDARPAAGPAARAAQDRSVTARKASARVTRTAKNLQLFTAIGALAGTPLLLYFAFGAFGYRAAAQFRIQDVIQDYGTALAWAVGLLASIFLWPIPKQHRMILVLLWLVRCGMTLGVMLPYEAIYGLDASTYYRFGLSLNDPLAWFSFGDGTLNIMGIVGLVSSLTEAYNAIKVLFSYVGLVSVYIFYRSAVICLGRENVVVLFLLGLFPSYLFWTSIVGKDPIVLLGIALYCYGVAGLIVQQRMSMLAYVVIGLAIASFIRVWLGLIFVTPLIATYVLAGRASALTKLIFILLAVPGFLVAFQGFAEQFSLQSTADLVATTDRISSSWATGGSAQQIDVDFDSIWSMLAFIPLGLFTSLFRPLPLEVPNIFGTFAGLENAGLLLLILCGVFRRGLGWMREPILLWAFSALIVWGAIYGFASYQNLGTAFRFRTQVTPILLLLGLYLTFGARLSAPGRPAPRPIPPPPEEAEAEPAGREA